MLYFNNAYKRHSLYRVYLVLILVCASFFAGGCDFGLQAIIMSPGLSQITIQKCETVAFEGFGIGGFPFESSESENGGLYGYYWDGDGNSIASRTDKRIDIYFEDEGTFTVSFTVTDQRGAHDTVETIVIVLPNEDDTDCDDDTTTTTTTESTTTTTIESTTTTTTESTTTTTTSPITTTTSRESTTTTSPTTTTTSTESTTTTTTSTTIPEIDEDDYTALQASIIEPTADQTIIFGESITFIGEAEGGTPWSDSDPYNYYWYKDGEFIDNSKSTTVYFDEEGEYIITFEVRDIQGVTDKELIYVTVTTTETNGNCQGCCSSHGGVECEDDETQCADGEPLSDTCRDKGCDACF
ncbi:PKD domain-containing protein [Desulfococcaceae bacterium HSG9]|nr:PKD domain-containing protein [Desulfococcaceae bacterium HSG9]